MDSKIKKAFLFAAGRGERLRPLTDKTPKPLLPIGNKAMIEYSLGLLQHYGVKEVVINLCYLGEQIEKRLGSGENYGLQIHYSKEETLLGTGGGLKKAELFFKEEEAFFTLNSDTIINCDLSKMAEFHFTYKHPATIAVVPWQEGYTKLQVNRGKLINIGSGDRLFSGLTIMTPKIFEELKEGPSNLILDGIKPIIQKEKWVSAFDHFGFWCDIGTPEHYEKVQDEWAAAHQTRTV